MGSSDGVPLDPQKPIFRAEDGHAHARIGDQEYVLVPSSMSEARAGAVLPRTPSEDASHLLIGPKLPVKVPIESGARNYLPAEKIEWVVTVEFAGDPQLSPRVIDALFDRQWRAKNGWYTAYGQDADTDGWTFLISADGPQAVTRLKFSWGYTGTVEEAASGALTKLYDSRLTQLSDRLRQFGEHRITASLPPTEAARRALELQRLKASLNRSAVLVLGAPEGRMFDGITIWDVMLCLGLKWGDMDCFHWNNSSDVGHDHFFSVETSTPPGYFLPEAIAAGRVHTEDLIFSFSIPRCHAPLEVFDAMSKVVEYCRRRLGGTIKDASGDAADLTAIRSEIAAIERALREAGLTSGAEETLRFF